MKTRATPLGASLCQGGGHRTLSAVTLGLREAFLLNLDIEICGGPL